MQAREQGEQILYFSLYGDGYFLFCIELLNNIELPLEDS